MKPIEAVPQEIPLDIIYEDAHLLGGQQAQRMRLRPPAIPKPDGTPGQRSALALQRQPFNIGISGPGIVHRMHRYGTPAVCSGGKMMQPTSALLADGSAQRGAGLQPPYRLAALPG